jgi:hypothetical protein
MRHLRAFGTFWWEFVVGDDWRVALGLAIVIAAAAALVGADVNAWWLIPVGVALVLAVSLARETRKT